MANLGPEERAELTRWLDQQRKLIKKQRRSGVDPGLIEQIGDMYQDLENRYCHQEALEVIEVAFEGLRYVKHSRWRGGDSATGRGGAGPSQATGWDATAIL